MREIISVQSAHVKARELHAGVRKRALWHGADGERALLIEMDAGARYPKLQVLQRGPAELYVLRGSFNDGAREYAEGSFVHYPAGSTCLPSSRAGCVLFAFFPEG